MKIKSCGVIPILKQNNKTKFLIIHHHDGHWSFPKGRMKKDETEIETAVREFKEETGIKDFKILNNFSLTEKYCFEKDGQEYNKRVKYFLALVKNTQVKLLKTELKDCKWLDFEHAMKLVTYQSGKEMIEKVKNELNDEFNF